MAADSNLAQGATSGHRYDAACAAALAARGGKRDTEDRSAETPGHWRQQALAWLREDLGYWTAKLEIDKPTVRQRLRHWQRDPDLAALRDPQALAKLPPKEARAWQALWAQVQDLLERAHRE